MLMFLFILSVQIYLLLDICNIYIRSIHIQALLEFMHCFVQNVLRAFLCFMWRRQISRPWERLPSSSFSFTSFVLSTFSEFLMLVSTSILSFAGKTIPFKFLRTSAGKFTIKYCSLSFLFLSLSLKLSARPPAAAAPVSKESFQIMNMRLNPGRVGGEKWALDLDINTLYWSTQNM